MNNKDNKPSVLFNNKYEQVRLLGEGSFGKAFLVESIEDKTLYVIKSINMTNMTEEEKREAIQEGLILEKLDHSNIIKFREVYVDKINQHTLNIVMDYADGGDLQVRIKSQKGKYFLENQILDWFTQICLAIKHIHDRKILHRDIKSQNIFLTKNGMVKLGDFGIAKCLNFTMDKAKTIVGTPYYLSPEIVHNKPYSFKSDIWSLGVLLYEMCALKMPFDAQNLPLLSLKIIKCSYNPLPPNFSKELRNLVHSMLNIDTNKRPNINEVLKAPIIKSRIRSFLTDKNFDSEFSHTVLHKFNILKSNHIGPGQKFDPDNLQKEKEAYYQLAGNNGADKIFQKPIIKKDINTPNNMNKQNIILKKNNHNNFDKDREKEREREKEKEVDLLRKNLLNGPGYVNREIFPVNIAKDNSNINSNLNNINNLNLNLNVQKEDIKKHNIMSPVYVLNNENNSRKNKPSLEIESSRTPKVSELKIPESNKRLLEKREGGSNSNNYNNINSQFYVNSSSDHNNNNNNFRDREREKKNIKKSSKDNNQSSGNLNNRRVTTTTNNTTDNTIPINTNLSLNKESEKEIKDLHAANSANIFDRKRSGSRTSLDDKGEKGNIKDFIKNARDKNKVTGTNNNNAEYLIINGKKDSIEREGDNLISNKINQNQHNQNNLEKLHIYFGNNNNINGNNLINIPSSRKERLNIPINKEIPSSNSGKETNREKEIHFNYNPKSSNSNVSAGENFTNFINHPPGMVVNSQNNGNYNNIYQNLFTNLNLPNDQKCMKDLNEYMETHKMLIELEKVQNDELEEVDYPEINDFRDEYLEEVRKINEEFSIDEENNIIIQGAGSSNNTPSNANHNIAKGNLNYGDIISGKIDEFGNEKEKFYNNNLIASNREEEYEYKIDVLNSSIKVENSIRKDLENELGPGLLSEVYEVINKSLNDDILNFDIKSMTQKIKNTCKKSNTDDHIFELSLNKIPDIYFLILKDRNRIKCGA